MKRYLARKAILNLRMAGVIVVSVAMLYYEMFYVEHVNFDKVGSLQILVNVYAISAYVLFAGMFPGIAYGFSLLEERNSGYIKFILQRMSGRRYILNKILFTGITGAVTTLVPYLFVVIPVKIFTFGSSIVPLQGIKDLMWTELSDICNGNIVFLLKGILLVMFGILWSEVTLLISLLVTNKYIAFVLPFVVFQLFWLLFPFRTLNPVFMIRSDYGLDTPMMLPYIVFLVYIIAVIAMIYFVFRRQRKHEKI